MKRQKLKYDVFRVAEGYGLEYRDEEYIGSTYAVSEKQAINNVRYNQRSDEAPNGGLSSLVIGGELVGTHVFYEARIADGKPKTANTGVMVQWI